TLAITPASAFSNAGLLDLAPDATLAVTGRAVFSSTGTLRTQVAGLNAGQIGRVTGTTGSTLGGKLQGAFASPYTPLAGDQTAPLVQAPSFTGAFASTCFDANPFGLGVQPVIDAGLSPQTLSLFVTPDSGMFPVF